MARLGLRLGAASLLVLAGAASSLLAARPHAVRATTTTATSGTTTSTAPVVAAFLGHGWGHGLGLSQWGAYGYAKHGWTYDRILSHYYTGTTLGPAPRSTVRVLLAQAKRVVLSSVVGWSVTDAAGAKLQLDPRTLTLRPTLAIPDHPELQPPFTFTARQPIVVGAKPFRGKLVVSSDGKRVQLVDVVALESYVKGVVPVEMPSGWLPEALKAQAVAARSYALANLTKNRDFDLYGDTRDQVYGGVDAESSAASDAVDATKGQVVLWNGKVADTLFFSTSGGRTASAADVTGKPVPYLVPVSDPYDTASPYHDWGPVLYDGAFIAKQLKLAGPISSLTATVGASGRVKTVTVAGANEAESTLTGTQLRVQLELRSTWFTSALFSIAAAARTVTYGGAASLTGFASGADTVTLEAKQPTGDWQSVGEVLLGADGAFTTIVKPQVSTQYRLAWKNVRAGLAKVAVAARVDARTVTGAVQGTVKPAVAGTPVQLQQQSGDAWTTVATTAADAGGAWTFASPAPGTYRVRAAPGHGVGAGISASLTVS